MWVFLELGLCPFPEEGKEGEVVDAGLPLEVRGSGQLGAFCPGFSLDLDLDTDGKHAVVPGTDRPDRFAAGEDPARAGRLKAD
jgi:hypothetical protein